jgi:putative flippase GtrA
MNEIKEFDYFKAWLIFFLVGTLGGALLGLILGSFLAAFLGAAGAPISQIAVANRILGIVVAIPVSYVTFRAVVGKFLFPKLWDDEGR